MDRKREGGGSHLFLSQPCPMSPVPSLMSSLLCPPVLSPLSPVLLSLSPLSSCPSVLFPVLCPLYPVLCHLVPLSNVLFPLSPVRCTLSSSPLSSVPCPSLSHTQIVCVISVRMRVCVCVLVDGTGTKQVLKPPQHQTSLLIQLVSPCYNPKLRISLTGIELLVLWRVM